VAPWADDGLVEQDLVLSRAAVEIFSDVTLAAALASLFSGRAVKPNLSMTGELTLTGRVLAIGGLKEKIIASFRDEINTVVFPRANLKDLEEIPAEIRAKMRLHPVETMDEVIELALEPASGKKKTPARPGKKVKRTAGRKLAAARKR